MVPIKNSFAGLRLCNHKVIPNPPLDPTNHILLYEGSLIGDPREIYCSLGGLASVAFLSSARTPQSALSQSSLHRNMNARSRTFYSKTVGRMPKCYLSPNMMRLLKDSAQHWIASLVSDRQQPRQGGAVMQLINMGAECCKSITFSPEPCGSL